jgi:FKBP-type peptidyl-prolyl cis-trans isomerase FkpA
MGSLGGPFIERLPAVLHSERLAQTCVAGAGPSAIFGGMSSPLLRSGSVARVGSRIAAPLFAAAILTGCFDKLSAPECTPVTFSEASVNGDTVTTTTGLRYVESTVGTGDAVEWCRNVAIHYTAFLLDGTEFDSSVDGPPLLFAPGLGGLIPGLEQGVIGMRAGGTRRLIIPPDLGFGPQPRRDATGEVVIPGNSTVVFDIEVVQASRGAPPPVAAGGGGWNARSLSVGSPVPSSCYSAPRSAPAHR